MRQCRGKCRPVVRVLVRSPAIDIIRRAETLLRFYNFLAARVRDSPRARARVRGLKINAIKLRGTPRDVRDTGGYFY
jgi:nitrous oxidase accessory protein NosD